MANSTEDQRDGQEGTVTTDKEEMLIGSDEEVSSVRSGSGSRYLRSLIGDGAVVRLEEGEEEHKLVKLLFLPNLSYSGTDASVVAVHKTTNSGFLGRARCDAFKIFAAEMEKKCCGDPQYSKYAIYSGSAEEIVGVVTYGFSSASGRSGVHLTPSYCCIHSALASDVDEDGLRHVLVCDVILGKMEAVVAGSDQILPSSKEFDSGTDNVLFPRKFIVWSAFMNSHIRPIYIISFKLGPHYVYSTGEMEVTYSIDFEALVRTLAHFLSSLEMSVIKGEYRWFLTGKMSIDDLLEAVEEIVGEELLNLVITLYGKHPLYLMPAPVNFSVNGLMEVHYFL